MATLPALKCALEYEGRTLRMVGTREQPEWIETATPAAISQTGRQRPLQPYPPTRQAQDGFDITDRIGE